jgi:hypothetical protein
VLAGVVWAKVVGVDEPGSLIEIQYLGSPANARILTDTLDKLGGLARYEPLVSSPSTDAAEVGLVVVRGLGKRKVVDAVNQILQSVPMGTIGVAFETPGVHRTLKEHKADLAAFVGPKGIHRSRRHLPQ